MKSLVVLSGAGISAESGIPTFRDAGGLWEGYSIEEVATPEAWSRQPELVLDFYNWRRKKLLEVHPNRAHRLVAALESNFNVQVITQNVDDLHERAGSTKVLHLHGELRKARCTGSHHEILSWDGPMQLGDCCSHGHQLRPHIVWFGEAVPGMEEAIQLVPEAEILIVIGTSLQVYPAASLMGFANQHCRHYYIDPNPGYSFELRHTRPTVIKANAIAGMEQLYEELGLPLVD